MHLCLHELGHCVFRVPILHSLSSYSFESDIAHLDINSQNFCTHIRLVFGHESKHEVTKQICHSSRTDMLILSYTVLNLLYLLSNFFGGSLNLDFWPFQDYRPNSVTPRALSSPSVSNSERTSECGPDRASPWHDHRLHSLFLELLGYL